MAQYNLSRGSIDRKCCYSESATELPWSLLSKYSGNSGLQMPIYSLFRYKVCFSALPEVFELPEPVPLSSIALPPFCINCLGSDQAMPFCLRYGLPPLLFRFKILLPYYQKIFQPESPVFSCALPPSQRAQQWLLLRIHQPVVTVIQVLH